MNHILDFTQTAPDGVGIFSLNLSFFQQGLAGLSDFICKVIPSRLWRMNWVVWLWKEFPDHLTRELWLRCTDLLKKTTKPPPLYYSLLKFGQFGSSVLLGFNLSSYVLGNYFIGPLLVIIFLIKRAILWKYLQNMQFHGRLSVGFNYTTFFL